MPCQKCGFENPDNSKFCNQCGYILASASTTPISTAPANYVTTQIGEKILAGKHQLEGERKIISVLFADIVNYDTLREIILVTLSG